MIKVYTALLLALFTPQTQVLEVKQVDKVLNVSVLIRSKVWIQDPETNEIKYGMSGCSGTYITPQHILTAAHCFSRPSIATWVKGTDGKSHKAFIAKIDPAHDLAVLAVITDDVHEYARVAESVRVGEDVINVGSPLGLPFLVSEGVVAQTGIPIKEFKSKYLITTAMINPGSSGGGAFNMAGDLIGVNTLTIGGLYGWAGISLAVSIEDIRRFLK